MSRGRAASPAYRTGVGLRRHERDWQELATLDPLWAILSDPARRYGGWDTEEFLATGRNDVGQILQRAADLGCDPPRGRALDFGSGAGRLTRALSEEFDEAVGVDISSEMVRLARELNADRPNSTFLVNVAPDLRHLEDESFDFVLSLIVLQHLPTRNGILRYIDEFMRVLRPGGLAVFQLPTAISWANRRQLRRRLYRLLRSFGASERFLYERLHVHPIRMTFIPRERVEAQIERFGGLVVEAVADDLAPGTRSYRWFVVKPADVSTEPRPVRQDA